MPYKGTIEVATGEISAPVLVIRFKILLVLALHQSGSKMRTLLACAQKIDFPPSIDHQLFDPWTGLLAVVQLQICGWNRPKATQ